MAGLASIPSLMSTDLPPEAYTRETLQEAFDGLQSQPDVVRNSVHTPDRLVSLFRKSQRLSDHDHPVSSKKFISDLKNLASSLDQFDGRPRSFEMPQIPQAQPSPHTNPQDFQQSLNQMREQQPLAPAMPKASQVVEPEPPSPSQFATSQRTTETVRRASFELTTKETVTDGIKIDELTKQRVQSVRERFNLSSEEEALRLLVSIGYEKFSNFP